MGGGGGGGEGVASGGAMGNVAEGCGRAGPPESAAIVGAVANASNGARGLLPPVSCLGWRFSKNCVLPGPASHTVFGGLGEGTTATGGGGRVGRGGKALRPAGGALLA